MNRIKLLLVDDHQLFRNGLKLLLNSFKEFEIVAEASNGKECLDILETTSFNVILMDINMPEMDGITATLEILKLYPDTKIIALSMYGEEDYYFKMVDSGAKGFLLKDSDINEVKEAIITVNNGGTYFSSDLLHHVIQKIKTRDAEIKESNLSKREKEVLEKICEGLSNQEIADTLFISKRTVDKHRANLLCKTNSKNTASLILYAIKHNLIDV